MDGSQWSRGWNFVVHAIAAFRKYPCLVLPILIVWLVYAPSVLYVKFYFHWNRHSTLDLLVFAFFFIAFLSLLILIACDVLLELIKQMEEDTPSLRSAVAATFRKDLINILPLAMTWAFIWFALLLLEALLSRRDDDDSDDPQLSAQSAAEAIADFGSFLLSRAFIQALEKGVRMVVFLILPAIAWEDMNFVEAAQKGLIVLKTHLGEFARGYALTYAAAVVVFLPPAIVFELGTRHHHTGPLVHFPDAVWVATILYCGLAWSFSLYLEQMFVAQLYLWHLKWERKFEVARLMKRPLPAFKDIEPPALLAQVPGFFGQNVAVQKTQSVRCGVGMP
jgi:hypothetical protein